MMDNSHYETEVKQNRADAAVLGSGRQVRGLRYRIARAVRCGPRDTFYQRGTDRTMEYADPLPQVPSLKDLRRGQAAAVQRFIDGADETVARLPTGYGKTRMSACCFAVLRAQDRADAMIVVVPTISQASQAAEDIPRDLGDLYGLCTKSCVVGDNLKLAIRCSKDPDYRVFVVTVQSLIAGATMSTVQSMLGNRRCFVVIDEYHHYGFDAAWTTKAAQIKRCALLAMSATPDRKGERPIFGEPHVNVTYFDAFGDGHVKALMLHCYDYRIDYVDKNTGEVISLNISELLDVVGSNKPDDIEKWRLAREARWTPKYVSPLISRPVERLIAGYANTGSKTQMIVYALCCSHAEVVCEQVRAMIPEGMSVDWVGTGPNGRSDDDNEKILNRFCPPKNARGEREWTLDILVNVGIASEGLDIRDATEAVFLNSPSINNSTKQAIGRLSRIIPRMPGLSGKVNVDAASDWAKYPGQIMKVMDLADGENADLLPEDPKPVTRDDRDYEPIPSGPLIKDVELIDIQSDPEFQAIKQQVKRREEEELEQKFGYMPFSEEQRDEWAADAALRYKKASDQRFNSTYSQARARDLLDARLKKVTGLALQVASERGRLITKEMPGELKRRINTAKKRLLGGVEALTAEELERHNEWIINLEAALLRGEVPSWL